MIQQYFCAVYDYVEKADLGKCQSNANAKADLAITSVITSFLPE